MALSEAQQHAGDPRFQRSQEGLLNGIGMFRSDPANRDCFIDRQRIARNSRALEIVALRSFRSPFQLMR